MNASNVAQPVAADKPPDLFPAVPAVHEPSNFDHEDWSPGNPDLLIPCQPTTKVYRNNFNQVVVCQDRPEDDEPAYVYFSPEYLMTLIDRLCDMAGIPEAGKRR
jgi:hypothetical protein